MLLRLKRHPFSVRAHFAHSAVLTYAVRPAAVLKWLPPGLALDEYKGHAMLAIALVQTRRLRPAGFPAFVGQDFFLAGYRLFVRYKSQTGRTLRGLRILRSHTDRRLMVAAGNLLTHYNYELARVTFEGNGSALRVATSTPEHDADLDVLVDLSTEVAAPPTGSPFASVQDARRFAGPLPFTFDYEQESDSIILIEGRRTNWQPRPVHVEVTKNAFIETLADEGACPVLANAFYVHSVDYRWLRGRREPLKVNRP